MNIVLNYLAISALTTAAATAVAMGEPAMLELAIARVGLIMEDQKAEPDTAVVSAKATDSLPDGMSSRTRSLVPVSGH